MYVFNKERENDNVKNNFADESINQSNAVNRKNSNNKPLAKQANNSPSFGISNQKYIETLKKDIEVLTGGQYLGGLLEDLKEGITYIATGLRCPSSVFFKNEKGEFEKASAKTEEKLFKKMPDSGEFKVVEHTGNGDKELYKIEYDAADTTPTDV